MLTGCPSLAPWGPSRHIVCWGHTSVWCTPFLFSSQSFGGWVWGNLKNIQRHWVQIFLRLWLPRISRGESTPSLSNTKERRVIMQLFFKQKIRNEWKTRRRWGHPFFSLWVELDELRSRIDAIAWAIATGLATPFFYVFPFLFLSFLHLPFLLSSFFVFFKNKVLYGLGSANPEASGLPPLHW